MTELSLGVIEPFGSPVWESNFTIFSNSTGDCIPEEKAKEYINRACRYAKLYNMYLVPERFMLMGYQCMCLISPQGNVVGAQKCIHWNTDVKVSNKRGATLEVLVTEFGGIALCVDVDVYRPEYARVASGMGAQFLVCSQQIARRDYNNSMVVSGVWSAAQGSPLYAISVTNEFHCICAPRAITKHDDGFIVAPNLKIPMMARLSAGNVDALPRRFCLSRKFYAVHRRELI